MTKPCVIAQSTFIVGITELEIKWVLVLAVTYSHNTVEVGGTHAPAGCVSVRVCKRGGECGTNWDLLTSSLSKWHRRHELRLHSCLVAGDIEAHAWTHRSSKRMRRSSLLLLMLRKNNGNYPPLECILVHLECLEWVEMKGTKKSIWIHASLTTSSTDCDLFTAF